MIVHTCFVSVCVCACNCVYKFEASTLKRRTDWDETAGDNYVFIEHMAINNIQAELLLLYLAQRLTYGRAADLP